jgi:carboxylesterase
MDRLADRLRSAGYDVVCPTLPGHGTQPEDLERVTWDDWLAAIPDADVLVGQSMGGSLVLAAAATRPSSVRAVVCINGLAPDPDAVDGLEWRRDRGHTWVDGGPAATGEAAYDRLPISALLAMAEGIAGLELSCVRQRVLVVHGALDEVVDPANSDLIAASLGGPVERLVLSHTGHVAVLGDEVELLAAAITEFLAGPS